MPILVPNLSPTERRNLAAVADGMPDQVMQDCVAFRRLLAFGYLEEKGAGRFQATPEGKRALRPKPDV